MKKHKLYIFTIISLSIFFMSGCKVRKMDTSNRVNIVCSIFPEYDWVRNIIGDDDDATTLTLLEKNGLDLHTYQPSDMDISIVSKCNLLVYTGGKSNQWISDIVKASSNSNLKVIDISEILKDQLIPDNSPEGGFDEHLWLSIKNARTVCEYFTQTLCAMVPDNSERYEKRFKDYIKKLDAMDLSFKSITQNKKDNTIIFCDPFPFAYLFREYNLNYYATVNYCGKDKTINETTADFLAEKLIELNKNAVVVLENSNKKVAKEVIGKSKNPNCDTLTMDSMQSVTLRQAFAGVSYIGQMQKNLESIQKALK